MSTPAPRTRVLVADANVALREIVAELLADEPDFAVVGQAGTAQEALDAVAAGGVDLVLVSEQLPDVPGSAVLPKLREAHPQVITALWTTTPNDGADTSVYRGATFRQMLRGLRLAVRQAGAASSIDLRDSAGEATRESVGTAARVGV